MNMVAPQGGGDSHLMGSPLQGGMGAGELMDMVQNKMSGGRRRRRGTRYRGGNNMNPFSAMGQAMAQNGGRRRSTYKRKGSKRRGGSRRSGSKRRRTYRKK